MLAAFVWWAILLMKKSEEIYQTKLALAKIEQVQNQKVTYETRQKTIEEERGRQRLMIWGEGAVFTITLLIGIWLINRAHNREIEASNQQKNFLLSITHELKSPIASIRLALDTFLKRDLENNQVKKLSQGALNETVRLNELVNDLLLSAKMENKYDLEIEDLNLSSLIEQQVISFSKMHPNVEITKNISDSTIKIQADRQGLILIISNLLENGVKYNYSNDKRLTVKLLEKNSEIILEVLDNGNGILEKHKNKIFEKFYRAGNEETRKTKGTGLGLYIVKEFVKFHHGIIEVKSNQPKGSIFKIILPKTQKDSK